MTTAYRDMTTQDLQALVDDLQKRYDEARAKGIKLNMARGKPSDAQLALSLPMLDAVNSHSDLTAEDGTDCRNYGVLAGLPEARRLMGELIGVPADNVIVLGNSSLAAMYDAISRAMTHGILGSTPWCKLERIKWICLTPGYDRHFAMTEHFGFELLSVPLTGHGPDMDQVEQLVADPAVKGIWCVPKYSNPTGETYSPEVVRRLAALKPAAPDFRIFWDNAYVVHHLYDDPAEQDELPDILSACADAGNPDMVYEFASTSKVTFPGAGISCMAASKANIDDTLAQLKFHAIGYDKLNQLRHVRFLRDKQGTVNHMMRHAAILRPKFKLVTSTFAEQLGDLGIARWTDPRGGYFVSLDVTPGCAREVVSMAADAGLTLTGAGATYPHGKDPDDSNIRIAPSLPPIEELRQALDLLCICIKLVCARHEVASRAH